MKQYFPNFYATKNATFERTYLKQRNAFFHTFTPLTELILINRNEVDL